MYTKKPKCDSYVKITSFLLQFCKKNLSVVLGLETFSQLIYQNTENQVIYCSEKREGEGKAAVLRMFCTCST